MKGTPVKLNNGLVFDSRTAAKKFFKGILDRAREHGMPVHITEKDEFSAVVALAERYDELGISSGSDDSKIGSGVCGVKVDYPKDRPRKLEATCFYLIRTDGTETDFSYSRAIEGEQNSCYSDLCSAVRDLAFDRNVKFGRDLQKTVDALIEARGWTRTTIPDGVISESRPDSTRTTILDADLRDEAVKVIDARR